ncbi:MAG TPA: hypothetical protein ENK59_05565 [Thioploca sp.]|nr:hypothetical protein [Thioploca sp.]
MLLSRTCVFLLIINFSCVIVDDITNTFGYQTVELAAKDDSRRQNTPQREGDANAAENDNKRKKEEKKDKKNQYSV